MRLSQLPRRTKGRDIDLRSIHVTGAWTCCCTVALDRSFRRNPRKSVLHGSVPTSHFLPSDERRGSWGPSFPPPTNLLFPFDSGHRITCEDSGRKTSGWGSTCRLSCTSVPPDSTTLRHRREPEPPKATNPRRSQAVRIPVRFCESTEKGYGGSWLPSTWGRERSIVSSRKISMRSPQRIETLLGKKYPTLPPADRRSTTHQDLPRGDPSRTTIPEERRGQLGGILCGEWHTRAGEWTDGEARHQNVCDACQHEPHKRARKEARHTSVSA